MITDILVVLVLLGIVGAAAIYIVKAKRRGVKCIGCPHAEACAHKGNCSGACSCPPREEKIK